MWDKENKDHGPVDQWPPFKEGPSLELLKEFSRIHFPSGLGKDMKAPVRTDTHLQSTESRNCNRTVFSKFSTFIFMPKKK